MSSPLAIAAATATLQAMLREPVEELKDVMGLDELHVTAQAPDLIRTVVTNEATLNVFLYNVVRNSGYANLGLPSRDARGERVTNPILGLDLCYLVSAYATADLHAEMLLGTAMQTLHDTPALSRAAIRDALGPPTRTDEPFKSLLAAGLADQFESLKIAPLALSSEEISRLWPSFQSPYRPSAAYVISVVLIESAHGTRTSLPVRRRSIQVVPFREIRIDRVVSAVAPSAPIFGSTTLRILGRQLGSPDAQVWVNSIDVTAGVVSRSAEEIRVNLRVLDGTSTLVLPPGLRAGPTGVQVVQPIQMGDPLTPREGFASNVGAFVLAPEITAVPNLNRVDVTVSPPVGARQRVRLLLNQSDAAAGAEPRRYTFAMPPGNGIEPPPEETELLSVPIESVTPGRYLVRLQVDGAQSTLTVDASGKYDQPEIAL